MEGRAYETVSTRKQQHIHICILPLIHIDTHTPSHTTHQHTRIHIHNPTHTHIYTYTHAHRLTHTQPLANRQSFMHTIIHSQYPHFVQCTKLKVHLWEIKGVYRIPVCQQNFTDGDLTTLGIGLASDQHQVAMATVEVNTPT